MSLKLVRRPDSPHWYIRGTIAGQKVYESAGTGRKIVAEQLRSKLEQQLWNRHIFGPRAVATFAEAAESYMLSVQPSPGQARLVGRLIQHFGETPLKDISQASLEAAYVDLLRPGPSPATMRRNVLVPLRAVLNHAADLDWCPAPRFKTPRQPKPRVRWLTPAEAEALIEAASPHLRPLIVFLLASGARMSEALELDWRHLHLKDGFVEFVHTKSGYARSVPLNERCVAELANLPNRIGPVFLRPDGLPYKTRNRERGGQIRVAFANACTKAGIVDLRPHDLRHTWATWLYNETKDLLKLMQYGGWRSLKMVEIYAHVVPEHVRLEAGLVRREARTAREE